MGWLFHCDRSWTAKMEMDRLTEPSFWKHADLIMQRRSFGKLWLLIRDKKTGHDTIILCLVKGPNKDSGAGYKDIDEGMGPNEVDCPLAMLHAARAPYNAYAYEWRQKCYAYHERRLAHLKAIKPGVIVEYGGRQYTLIDRNSRSGWNVLATGGFSYRMKDSQVMAAKVVA